MSRLRGRAVPPGARVTLKMLAEHLGLSPASISLVLNRAPAAKAIPRRTQERIQDAARRFHYRPNSLARSLRRRRSFTIGVMVPEISEGYAATVMSGIEDSLLQAGYLYFITSHRHRPDLLDEYPKLLLERSVDGIIAIDTPWTHAPPIPVVAVSGHGRTPGVTNIVVDHERAAMLALQHLHALGHRAIAIIRGQRFTSDSSPRWRAIREAARRLRLTLDPRLTVQLDRDSPWPDVGHEVTERLIATGRPFTALFAFNDISAIGAIAALRESGRDVPRDVSVVGFDDIQSAAYQTPGLTTVRQPLREMGVLAAETVVDRIAPPDGYRPVRVIRVEPTLVVRGSTAPVRPPSA
ncbi:MAG: LacI family transcriptional regulator [Acidobacteria bacterium]|nr:MAG: LacI family transcriptional regulator [Acidobacteriota bacterium]